MDKLLQMYDIKGHTITVRQLDLGLTDNYRAILQRVKQSEEKYIVAHCSTKILPELFKQAQQVGLLSDAHYWFITSLDLHLVDLEPFMYGGTNITGIRLINPEDPRLVQITSYWHDREIDLGRELPQTLEAQTLSTQVALLFDSVLLFATAFVGLQGTRHVEPMSLNCDDSDTLVGGMTFQNIMKTIEVRGLTRDIKFDNFGFRTKFTLDVIELESTGLLKVGEWNESGVTMTRTNLPSSLSGGEEGSLRNRSFIVLTALVGKLDFLLNYHTNKTNNFSESSVWNVKRICDQIVWK